MTPDFWEWQRTRDFVEESWMFVIRERLDKGSAPTCDLAQLCGIRAGVEYERFTRCLDRYPDIRKIGFSKGPSGHPNNLWERGDVGTHRTMRYMAQPEIEAIIRLYLEDERSLTSIGKEFGRNHRTIGRMLARLGFPPRAGGWRPKSATPSVPKEKRPRVARAAAKAPGKVNWGYQKPIQMAPSQSPLERAKDVLRRKGYVVFEPWRFDVTATKGIVHVDHLRLTAAEVIQRAGI